MYDSLISLGEQNSELRGLTRTYTFNKQVGNCFFTWNGMIKINNDTFIRLMSGLLLLKPDIMSCKMFFV